jgi:hypothetical protein
MPEASIGVASAPPASTSARRREIVWFMTGEMVLFRGFFEPQSQHCLQI